jgi:hypothetical protein
MTRFKTGLFAVAAMLATAAPNLANAEYVSKTVPQTQALGTGPYKAVMEADPTLATHTLYHPQNMAVVKGKLPIVAWAEGGCANEGNRFRWFLSEIASHGYFVLAIGPIAKPEMEIWKPEAPQPAVGGPPPQLPPPRTHSSQLTDAINWAIKENGRAGSRFQGKLDPSKIAVMGMSCGGAQTIEASVDPRVTTSVMWNSGLFPEPTTMGGGKPLSKDDLKKLHAPIAYISGDASDVAFVNANDDFERINHIPVFRAYRHKTGHGGTYGEPNGGAFGPVGVAWLDWRLKGDANAGKMFLGPKCGLCTNAEWVVKQKNLR